MQTDGVDSLVLALDLRRIGVVPTDWFPSLCHVIGRRRCLVPQSDMSPPGDTAEEATKGQSHRPPLWARDCETQPEDTG